MSGMVVFALTWLFILTILHFFYWHFRVLKAVQALIKERGNEFGRSSRTYRALVDQELLRKRKRAFVIAIVMFVITILVSVINGPLCLALSLINERNVCQL